jgi:paraquat-inducible protein A
MSATAVETGARLGILRCEACAMLNRANGGELACTRCGAHLHVRKPNSISRAWAFLAAALICYIPANVLPVLYTGTIFEHQVQTIMSGVIALWQDGSWILAAIVFVASICVPIGKIIAMAILLTGAQRRSVNGLERRARLYRFTSYIGRWSMVDIFVGGTLVALVQFSVVATIHPGPGAVWFGAVVVLTMLSSMSFDPRLTWDALEAPRHG